MTDTATSIFYILETKHLVMVTLNGALCILRRVQPFRKKTASVV